MDWFNYWIFFFQKLGWKGGSIHGDIFIPKIWALDALTIVQLETLELKKIGVGHLIILNITQIVFVYKTVKHLWTSQLGMFSSLCLTAND